MWSRLASVLQTGRSLPAPLARLGASTSLLFLYPVSGIVFVRAPWLGALMWLALAAQPRLLVSGILGIIVGEAVRRLTRNDDISGQEGCLKANAFLAALAAGWMTGPAGLGLMAQAGLIAGAAGLAAILAAAIRRALAATTLPPMVWGYCIVACLYFLLFPHWTMLAITRMDWGLAPVSAADWGAALLRSLGALMFSPTPWAGLVMAFVILAWSPLMFICGLVGWISGVLVAQSLLSLGEVYYWLPASYNFFLAGVALGSVRYLPSRGALPIAAGAGAIASVVAIGLQHLFAGSPAAYLPIPLGLTVVLGAGVLFSAEQRGFLQRNPSPALPPEIAWRRAALDVLRWGHREPLLGVPLAGEVEVTQGFSGRLSHAGRWRHAVDLQRPAARGTEGQRPSLWEAPVYAPAAGVIESARNDVPDNPLGVSNFQDNWGNFVIIRLDQGGWAMLAHLKQWSIPLAAGTRVAGGAFLGVAGNSGRSPTPHLHVQAQQGPAVGAATARFRMVNYMTEPAPGEGLLRWHASGVPAEGTVLSAALPNPAVRTVLTGMMPGQSLWSVDVKGRVPSVYAPGSQRGESTEVFLDEFGQFHHGCGRRGEEIVSRMDADAWRIISITPRAAPLLRLLALGLPVVPYAAFAGMMWQEHTVVSPAGLDGVLLPLRRDPFGLVACRCLVAPGAEGGRLVVHADVLRGRADMPISIVTELEGARGCVSLKAQFTKGSLTFAMLSFVPGLPLRASSGVEEDEAMESFG